MDAAFCQEKTVGVETDDCFMHLSNGELKKYNKWASDNCKYAKYWFEYVDISCKSVPLSSFKIAMEPELVPKTKNRMARCYLAMTAVFTNTDSIESYWRSQKQKAIPPEYLRYSKNKRACLQIACLLIMLTEVKSLYV